VLPAYNAERTLKKTINDIPPNTASEVVLVDDGSCDQTIDLAVRLGISTFKHRKNLGYGANQKSCYKIALKKSADIVVMLHPDYQYDPKLIPYFVSFIEGGYFDVMLGSRIRSRAEAREAGMPRYKYYANRALSFVENILSGQNLSEWHTGMRAYKRKVLENINFTKNSNDFVFDSQVLFQIIERGFKIGEISVPAKYEPDSSSINFIRSVKYGLGTLIVAFAHWFNSLKSK